MPTNQLTPIPLGQWRFAGYLGERIDRILDSRITGDFAKTEIIPELLGTLRARVDDRLKPGVGFWQGEFWGKWVLSAVAACRYLQSDELKSALAELIEQTLATQDEDGYLGTYHDSSFLANEGKGGNWNVWSRKYQLWGMLESYELLGDEHILAAAVRFTDHLLSQVGPGQVDIILTGALFGLPSTSILGPIVRLYRHTGEQRYLDYAEYIVDQWQRHPDGPPDIVRKGLANEPLHEWFPNPMQWAKSYEFISCVEGLVDLCRVVGNGDYLTAALNIYRQLCDWERSPAGSVSFDDKFIGSNRLLNTVGEICDIVYWNRLSHELLLLTDDPRYADEVERSLYNGLLCGMNREGTWGLRRLRLSHQHVPSHRHCQLKHQQCCVANSPRGLLQAAETAVLTDSRGVSIALYSSGEGSVELPSGQLAGLRVLGDYPASDRVVIELSPADPEEFRLRLRIPAWSDETEILLDGQRLARPLAGAWCDLERCWSAGDRLELVLDLGLRAEAFDASLLAADDPLVSWSEQHWAQVRDVNPEAPPHTLTVLDARPHGPAVALFRGPVLLCRDTRLGGDPLAAADLDLERHPEVLAAPEDLWMAFELPTAAGPVRLCDFASAGNTWDDQSRFSTWFAVD